MQKYPDTNLEVEIHFKGPYITSDQRELRNRYSLFFQRSSAQILC